MLGHVSHRIILLIRIRWLCWIQNFDLYGPHIILYGPTSLKIFA